MTARGNVHSEALAALRLVLGAEPPAGLRTLSAGELRRLAGAIEDARERHSKALNLALDEAFLQVPGLLRGTLRRVILR